MKRTVAFIPASSVVPIVAPSESTQGATARIATEHASRHPFSCHLPMLGILFQWNPPKTECRHARSPSIFTVGYGARPAWLATPSAPVRGVDGEVGKVYAAATIVTGPTWPVHEACLYSRRPFVNVWNKRK